MIHFIPESATEASPHDIGPYGEAVARLSSIRQALACVEQFAGAEPSESMAEARLAAVWPSASPALQRCYDTRSARAAAAAAAGLEAIADLQAREIQPNPVALERLKRELGSQVAQIDQLFSL